MTTLKSSAAPALAHLVKDIVHTDADGQSPMIEEVPKFQKQWQEIIDRLIDWGRHSSLIDEDGLESPSTESIDSSYHLVKVLRDERHPVPDRVVENGEGGIVFELFDGNMTETFEIDSDGLIEYMIFVSSRLVQRKQLFDG